MRILCSRIYCIKTVAERRNVGDAAYAMSHAAARACTVHTALAAGRGTEGYQVTGIQLAAATLYNGQAVRCAGL